MKLKFENLFGLSLGTRLDMLRNGLFLDPEAL